MCGRPAVCLECVVHILPIFKQKPSISLTSAGMLSFASIPGCLLEHVGQIALPEGIWPGHIQRLTTCIEVIPVRFCCFLAFYSITSIKPIYFEVLEELLILYVIKYVDLLKGYTSLLAYLLAQLNNTPNWSFYLKKPFLNAKLFVKYCGSPHLAIHLGLLGTLYTLVWRHRPSTDFE